MFLVYICIILKAGASPFIGSFIDRTGKRRLYIALTCLIFILSQFLFAILPAGEGDIEKFLEGEEELKP